MAATRQASDLTLGFIGTGKVSKRDVYAQLDDYIEAHAENGARFILATARDLWSPGLATVRRYAVDKDIPFEVVHDGTAPPEALESARETTRVKTVEWRFFSKLVNAGEKARAILLWDDADEDYSREVYDMAATHEVEALDLTKGLQTLTYTDVPDSEEAEELTVEPDEPEQEEEVAVAVDTPPVEVEAEAPAEPQPRRRPKIDLSPDRVWTPEELEEYSRPKLVRIAEARGIQPKKGTWKKTLIEQILKAQEAPAEPALAPVPAPTAQTTPEPEAVVDPVEATVEEPEPEAGPVPVLEAVPDPEPEPEPVPVFVQDTEAPPEVTEEPAPTAALGERSRSESISVFEEPSANGKHMRYSLELTLYGDDLEALSKFLAKLA